MHVEHWRVSGAIVACKTDRVLGLLAFLLGRDEDVDRAKWNQSMSLIVSAVKQIRRLSNWTHLHYSRRSTITSWRGGQLSRGLNGLQGWTLHKQRELSWAERYESPSWLVTWWRRALQRVLGAVGRTKPNKQKQCWYRHAPRELLDQSNYPSHHLSSRRAWPHL